MSTTFWSVLYRWTIRGLIAYALILIVVMMIEEKLIFFPSRYPQGDWSNAPEEVEDAWFESADGTRLHGWYRPHASRRAVVLFAHGNAGNITHRAHQLQRLHQLGLAMMIFDYRGYGRSSGRPTEEGVLADARAARRWLADRAKVPEQEVVLLGESIGGAVMVDLASRDGARGLILENTFSSVPDVAAIHYPFLPVRLLMRTRFNSQAKISDYHGPLLMCHGQADSIVPIRLGHRLFEAANEPKRFVQFEQLGHNDPLPARWYDAIDRFIEQLEPKK